MYADKPEGAITIGPNLTLARAGIQYDLCLFDGARRLIGHRAGDALCRQV